MIWFIYDENLNNFTITSLVLQLFNKNIKFKSVIFLFILLIYLDFFHKPTNTHLYWPEPRKKPSEPIVSAFYLQEIVKE